MWKKLMGKRVVAFRGHPTTRNGTDLSYILFDDGETYIELSEQDSYSFHDCNWMARLIQVRQDAQTWQLLMDKVKTQEPTTSCIF